MTLEYENPSPQHIVINNEVYTLTLGEDHEWRDQYGTIWALATDNYAGPNADNRAGVGIFSLSKHNPLNEAAGPHDYAYSSPAYQSFHTRKDADLYLEYLLKQMPSEQHSSIPQIFYFLTRLFGSRFWENDATNN